MVFTFEAAFTFLPEESQISYILFILHVKVYVLLLGLASLGFFPSVYALSLKNTGILEQHLIPCTEHGWEGSGNGRRGVFYSLTIGLCTSCSILKGELLGKDQTHKRYTRKQLFHQKNSHLPCHVAMYFYELGPQRSNGPCTWSNSCKRLYYQKAHLMGILLHKSCHSSQRRWNIIIY